MISLLDFRKPSVQPDQYDLTGIIYLDLGTTGPRSILPIRANKLNFSGPDSTEPGAGTTDKSRVGIESASRLLIILVIINAIWED
jgi:hypothetical protein